jgi:transposase
MPDSNPPGDSTVANDFIEWTGSASPGALKVPLRYRPERFHAKGGLGEVWLAQDQELHRDVALKRIQPRYRDDAESRRRFLLEAEIIGRLEHPGVVPVYGLHQGEDSKIHLVCDSHGIIVGIHVTAGQRHQSKFFEPTMARRLFHQRLGQRRWPLRLAGDKGYSYPRIRRWCRRRRVEAVIPTRQNQPREENFDKATDKRRCIVEQVVGWYKKYRSLGTRNEKLPLINYQAEPKT